MHAHKDTLILDRVIVIITITSRAQRVGVGAGGDLLASWTPAFLLGVGAVLAGGRCASLLEDALAVPKREVLLAAFHIGASGEWIAAGRTIAGAAAETMIHRRDELFGTCAAVKYQVSALVHYLSD